MLDTICEMAADLIGFASTASRPRQRAACAGYIEDFFSEAGIPFTVWEPGDVRSLVASLAQEGEPEVCLCAHYDVVEADPGEFRPRREGDLLYGRGSADMKTSLAAMMVLVRELAGRSVPPPVALMVTGDEESGGERGAAHILKNGFAAGFAVAGEPTGLLVCNQAKGVLALEVEACGASCHSARPWEGENAVLGFLREFPAVREVFGEAEPGEWRTTMAPTVLRAGDAVNRVPDRCVCRLDIRHVPADEPEDIVERVRAAAPGLGVRVVERGTAFFTDPAEPGLLALRRAAAGVMKKDPGFGRKHAASDARHFTAAGIPAAVFGPGGGNIHGSGEWVDLRQADLFYRALEAFLTQGTGPSGARQGLVGKSAVGMPL